MDGRHPAAIEMVADAKAKALRAVGVVVWPMVEFEADDGLAAAAGDQQAFTLHALAGQLAGAADGLGLLARFLDGGLLEMLPKLHFTEDALTLQLLLQGTKRLIDIVVANTDLHVVVNTFLG